MRETSKELSILMTKDESSVFEKDAKSSYMLELLSHT